MTLLFLFIAQEFLKTWHLEKIKKSEEVTKFKLNFRLKLEIMVVIFCKATAKIKLTTKLVLSLKA